MSKIHFVAQARQDFLSGVRWYNQAQPSLGARFAQAVQATIARALAHPMAGKPAIANTRRMIVKEFPYSVFYRATAKRIGCVCRGSSWAVTGFLGRARDSR